MAQLVKKSTCNMWDLGSVSGLGRSPGEGKGYPLQYSGLENSVDCTVHGVTKSRTWLSDFYFTLGVDITCMYALTCAHMHAAHTHCTHTLWCTTTIRSGRKPGRFSQGSRAVTLPLQSGIYLLICSNYLIKPALSEENKYFKSFYLPFFCSQSEFSPLL